MYNPFKSKPLPQSSDDFLADKKVISKAQKKQDLSASQIVAILPIINKHKSKLIIVVIYMLLTSVVAHIYFLVKLLSNL
jgi:hypothetical protein